MIRDRNIADDAQIQVHKIMGSAGLLMTGEMFWVGDSGDAAFNAMRSKVPSDRLYTDLDTCVGACTANRGDVIVLMEGYSKSVSAAADLDLDVSGIKVVFLGEGTTKANITFNTAVTADMDIDATNITFVNPKFVAGIDSLQGPIDVNATDFTMINAEYHDATDIETIDAVIATAGATRLKIDGYKYFCGTETADLKQSHIQLNGCDDIELKNIDIRGNFFVGNIENVTDEVLNIRAENVYCENLNATPKPSLFLDADATGSMKNVKLKIASGTTYVNSVGKVSWDDRCEGFMGDGYAGEPLGTVLGSGLEGKIDTIDTNVDSILVDTAVIGALGAGLTDLGGMSTGMKAEVNAEADSALNTAVPATPTANSLNDILSELDGANTYDNTTDSLEAIRNRVDTLNTADQIDLDAILADTITIGDATLPVAPVAGSLARFVASGGTALGTQLPDSKSLYDMLRLYGEGYLATKPITLSTAAVPVTEALFTVTGEVEVVVIGYTDVAVTSTGLLTLEAGIVGATAGLIALTAVAALTINKLWVDATPAVLVTKPSKKIIANSANISHIIKDVAATAGAVTYYCWWRPLSSDGNVVAA